jgi:hypothetical protein
VPTDHNVREEYQGWQALEWAWEQFMADVNTRPHRVTRGLAARACARCSLTGTTTHASRA